VKFKDGIAFVAIHIREYDSTSETYSDELLLENIGPARVEQINDNALLLTAGWRVDGHELADKGREICAEESTLFGVAKNRDFAERLGWGLVNYLARCHVQESTRSLATAGLLAVKSVDDLLGLYLVDTTGLYQCRALAIGCHSNQINNLLLEMDFGDDIMVDKGAETLLQLLRDCQEGEKDNDNSDKSEPKNPEIWRIPDDSIAEIVTLHSKSGEIKRRREIFARISGNSET
jgi:20S proteasome alpha/beta subunit